jgi:hypothetical protein
LFLFALVPLLLTEEARAQTAEETVAFMVFGVEEGESIKLLSKNKWSGLLGSEKKALYWSLDE